MVKFRASCAVFNIYFLLIFIYTRNTLNGSKAFLHCGIVLLRRRVRYTFLPKNYILKKQYIMMYYNLCSKKKFRIGAFILIYLKQIFCSCLLQQNSVFSCGNNLLPVITKNAYYFTLMPITWNVVHLSLIELFFLQNPVIFLL